MLRSAIAVLSFSALALAEDALIRPKGIPVNTWVREDIFAGFMAGDMPRFEVGMTKVEQELKANPTDTDALAWRGGGKLLRAVRAHESGMEDVFTRLYADARNDFDRAAEIAGKQPVIAGVLAIAGGSYVVFADRFPAELRREAWTRAQENYQALLNLQKPYLVQLPPHMRGELLAGLAQAAQRLGDTELANTRLAELIAAMPASAYANRALRWQEQPGIAGKTSLTCQTCHEDGRLEATATRLKTRP